MQHESSSCSFWALFVAFAIVLQIPVDAHRMRKITVLTLKQLLASIYANYMGDINGDVLKNAFAA
jgi:hypothetical protein